ncbi:MAG: N-methyl-L-tryptophan oxidase [Actinomycetota bacterium]|nr:N-methyl-L-tryptophan oxidase [Actinomycetota bacterium]
MRTHYEYIVVGLGGIGSAAVYRLARLAGSDVLGLEQFELGHDNGASQDHSRIVRLSYHTPAYVRLAKGAFAAWHDLEEDWGRDLLITTGGLDLSPAAGGEDLSSYSSSLSEEDVSFELLDASEIMRRWPQFRLSEDVAGLFQEDAGIAPAALCNAAHTELARQNGATLLERTPVTSISVSNEEIEVVANGRRFTGRKLVVTADAWTNEVLAPLNASLPLRVTQEQVTYFRAPVDEFGPERMPVWIWLGDPCFYGIPVFGEAGIKIGQDVGGAEVTASSRTFEVDESALARVAAFASEHLPSAAGDIIRTKSCLYTMPPDRDFVIDEVPGSPGVYVAQGAAHGYKFAAVFGKILAELAVDGRTEHDLSPFGFEREFEPALF